jgi:hypothetical protein
VWVAEQSDERVVVKGRRRGEQETYETVWTPERVKLAGLDSNAKYRTSRQQMMVARGQAEIARQVAADALHGVPYSVEELEDLPPLRGTAAVDRPRPATLAEIVAPAAEPEPVDIGDAPEAMTTAQGRKLYALLKKTGREDRAVALTRIGEILERDVASTKELSKDEAIVVIDALETEEKQPQPDPWAEPIADAQPELEP